MGLVKIKRIYNGHFSQFYSMALDYFHVYKKYFLLFFYTYFIFSSDQDATKILDIKRLIFEVGVEVRVANCGLVICSRSWRHIVVYSVTNCALSCGLKVNHPNGNAVAIWTFETKGALPFSLLCSRCKVHMCMLCMCVKLIEFVLFGLVIILNLYQKPD